MPAENTESGFARGFVLIPRCVPRQEFQQVMDMAAAEFPGRRIVVLESNEANLGSYGDGVEVIHYLGKRFLSRDMFRLLRRRLKREHCESVVVPLTNCDGGGFEELLRFARSYSRSPRAALPSGRLVSPDSLESASAAAGAGRPAYALPPGGLRRRLAVFGRRLAARLNLTPKRFMVQLQTVSTCNGRCVFCPYPGSWGHKNPGVMEEALFERIVTDLSRFRLDKVCLYLQNEPLLDPRFFPRLRRVRDALRYRLLEVSTNASVLDAEKAAELVDLLSEVPHEVWISFHGISAEGYRHIMGLDFEQSVENVVGLLRVADKRGLKIIIRGAGAALDPASVRRPRHFDFMDFRRFWEGLFKKRGIECPPELKFLHYHSRAGNVAEEFGSRNVRLSLDGFYCWRVDRALHILYNGDVIICCNDYQREEVLGNLGRQTIAELFRSKPFRLARRRTFGMEESPEDYICKRCGKMGG